jgi:creatinine amidohydrolase
MWQYCPELVNLEICKTLKPTNLTFRDLEVWRHGGDEARRITPRGYFGDPASASPERGKEAMEAYGKAAAEALEAFLQSRASLPNGVPPSE